jgi:hypothetical protein
MSTISTPRPADGTAPQVRGRTPNPQFIPLSELAAQRLTFRDLLPVFPAALISLVLYSALLVGLLWYNASSADAGPPKTKTIVTTAAEETRLDEQDQGARDYLNPDATDFSTITETMTPMEVVTLPGENPQPDLPPGLIEPPKPDQFVQGIGSGNEGGVQGHTPSPTGDDRGIGGPFFLEGRLGAPGSEGAGIMGDGSGLPGGNGFGNPKGGGFGWRNSKTLDLVKREGGTDESERAVALGLKWLALHQSPDGRWSLNRYHVHNPQCRCKTPAEENVRDNDTAATAFGLLPFLGAGHTHKKKTGYEGVVFRGLSWLISKQDAKGDLGGGMYAHALGTIALCEAYGMTSDPKLRVHAQRAINFIVYAQNPMTGGWRYAPRTDGDTSVVAWQVMALRSGQMAGLEVPSSVLDLARRWLDSCGTDDNSRYSYTPGSGATPPMTAAGLLNRQYLGWGPRNPSLHKGCQYLLQHLPPSKPANENVKENLGRIYYYYYATQVMHHMEGEYWQRWNPLMRDFLIRTQEKDGHMAGSWSPVGADYGNAGGRIYATSLAILTLEVYYRHLPLYRRYDTDKDNQPKKDEMKPEGAKPPAG